MGSVRITHFTDPGCPFAYSASPAFAVLRWRYGAQLEWRIVTIGLSEDPERYVSSGYTPTRMTVGNMGFRRYGMPFISEPRERIAATSRACRAIIAARELAPGRENDVLRALQFGWFTTTLVLDEDAAIAKVLSTVEGLDVNGVIAAIDRDETVAAYEADKLETRSAEGGPTHFQGKARQTDGPVRFSAPSLAFETEAGGGRRLEAGGFQPLEAYDVLIANLDPTLERRAPAEEPLEVLREFPSGLVTQELAAVMTENNAVPDRDASERALVAKLAEGSVRRTALGDDALWQTA